MGFYEYALKSGSSAATLDNIEDTFISILSSSRHYPPTAEVTPPGAAVTVTLDQNAHIDGTVIVRWRWSVLPYAAFAHLINTYLGGFANDSAAVSIRTRNEENGYSNYNAKMVRPVPGQDYQRGRNGWIVDLTITFRNLVAY